MDSATIDKIRPFGGEHPYEEHEMVSSLFEDRSKLLTYLWESAYDLYSPLSSKDPIYTRVCTYQRERLKFILKHVKPGKDETILDVGCGCGGLSWNLARAGARVYAIDIEEESIDFAKEFHKMKEKLHLDLLFSDGLNISFRNEVFDKIVCTDMVEHLDTNKKLRLLAEMRRTLKPSGRIHIHTPNANRALLGVYFRKLRGLFRGTFSIEGTAFAGNEKGHIGLIAPDKLVDLAKKQALRITDIHYFGAHIPYLHKHLAGLDHFLGSMLPYIRKYSSFSILIEGTRNTRT